jgi:hypothetical protein
VRHAHVRQTAPAFARRSLAGALDGYGDREMSRSIHQNRGKKHLRRGSSDHAEVVSALVRKRRVKRFVRLARSEQRPAPSLPVSSDALVVSVVDHGPGIYYPATETDLRCVMDRLPPGALVGLTKVQLELGTAEMLKARGTRRDSRFDPYFGRPSIEIAQGVYEPALLGLYRPRPALIHLFAYVLGPDVILSPKHELMLKLEMLDTLVHELAHHQDRMMRTARGRWLADGRDRDEVYAGGMAAAWTRETVRPYLREQHGVSEKELDELWNYAV